MLIVADANGVTDGSAHNFLSQGDFKISVLLVSRVQGFKFNENINSLAGKKYVVIDFTENGWDWDMRSTHKFAVNTSSFHHIFEGHEWARLDDFIRKNPPALYFIRELLNKDSSDYYLPIQYPCWHNVPPVESKQSFLSRPFQVFNSWGLSHEYRKTLHGNIWQQSGRHGYSVCDSMYHIEKFLQEERCEKKWMTLNIPHYARQPIETIIHINGLAKISISIAGAGRNCFRHAESPINAAMYMWQDEIKYSHPWEHGVNCIKSEQGKEIETITEWLDKPNELYDVYVSGTINCDKYRVPRYLSEYIQPLINKA
jgi:hypothetical protein